MWYGLVQASLIPAMRNRTVASTCTLTVVLLISPSAKPLNNNTTGTSIAVVFLGGCTTAAVWPIKLEPSHDGTPPPFLGVVYHRLTSSLRYSTQARHPGLATATVRFIICIPSSASDDSRCDALVIEKSISVGLNRAEMAMTTAVAPRVPARPTRMYCFVLHLHDDLLHSCFVDDVAIAS